MSQRWVNLRQRFSVRVDLLQRNWGEKIEMQNIHYLKYGELYDVTEFGLGGDCILQSQYEVENRDL